MNIIKNTAVAGSVTLCVLSLQPAAAQTTFPEKCKSDMSMPAGMGGHQMATPSMAMQQDHQKESMAGMKSMGMDMMQGMMKDDSDVAFACGMIAHHMGAISMAEVELEHGDNDEMKAAAQKVIDDQTKEIVELAAWVEKEVK